MEDTDSREQIGQLQNIIAELQAANRELTDVNACLHVKIEAQEERTRRFASFPQKRHHRYHRSG